jgi:serine/threonine protein kinase
MLCFVERIVRSPDQSTKKLFKNIEFSGKGGFGRVFGAKDRTTKKHVAIKKLPHVSEKDKRNNWCEIGFLATCKHPNIVRFLDAWEVKDEVWIVMEFLEGGTLHEAIKVHQFCERHIAYIAREVLKALDFLHNNKFVHRDLKSANVMMSVEGEIKLIDFGLCADVSEGERTQMVGSPFWMPPEMIRREPHGCPVHLLPFLSTFFPDLITHPSLTHSLTHSHTSISRMKIFVIRRIFGVLRCVYWKCI